MKIDIKELKKVIKKYSDIKGKIYINYHLSQNYGSEMLERMIIMTKFRELRHKNNYCKERILNIIEKNENYATEKHIFLNELKKIRKDKLVF